MNLLTSGGNAVSFIQPSAPILDDHIAELWKPLLGNLPSVIFQRNARENRKLKPLLFPYL